MKREHHLLFPVQQMKAVSCMQIADQVVRRLIKDEDYEVDEKARIGQLTEAAMIKLKQHLILTICMRLKI